MKCLVIADEMWEVSEVCYSEVLFFSVDFQTLLKLMSSKVDSAFAPDNNQINMVRNNIYDYAMRVFKRAHFKNRLGF